MTEPDLARRSLLYALPQQFAGLKDVVRDTLDAAFSASRFKEKPLLRGVYFTSGTQEGMPFDRVMSALSRRFEVEDRKSTRLNSSHSQISYAVFCLKKKNKKIQDNH